MSTMKVNNEAYTSWWIQVLYTSNRKEKEELVQGVVLGTPHALPVPLLKQVESLTSSV